MGVTIESFADNLLASGLVSPDELSGFRARLRAKLGRPADAEQLAAALVQTGKLTSYQADRISAGQPQGLILGNNVILGGQVGVADKISLGDGVVAYAKAAIPGNVASGEVVCGVPAIPARQFVRSAAVFKALPEMARSLRQLEKQHSEKVDAADP